MKRLLFVCAVTACAPPRAVAEPPRTVAAPKRTLAEPTTDAASPTTTGPRSPPTPPVPAPSAAATESAANPTNATTRGTPRGLVVLPSPAPLKTVVSFPDTSAVRAPVLVATHGAGDTPEALCTVWRAILGDRGVILCPGGPRMRFDGESRYYPDHLALERIVGDALHELTAVYSEAVDVERATYTGYSQGATMGALILDAHGAEFPTVALLEGGFDDWTTTGARRFHDAGGRRVLFVCGRRACVEGAERSAAYLRREHVEARVVSRVPAGHIYGGAVAEAAKSEFDWLVEGDQRWQQCVAPKSAP